MRSTSWSCLARNTIKYRAREFGTFYKKLVMMRFEKNLSNATLDLLLRRVLSTSGIKVGSNSRSLIQSVKEVLTFLAQRVLLIVGAKDIPRLNEFIGGCCSKDVFPINS